MGQHDRSWITGHPLLEANQTIDMPFPGSFRGVSRGFRRRQSRVHGTPNAAL